MRTADSMPTLPHGRGGLHTLTTFRRPRASGLFARPVSPSTRTAEHTRLYLSKCSATLASTRVPRTSAVLGRHGDAARRLTHIGPVCAVDKPPHGRRLAPPRQRFWCGKRVRPNGRSLARSYARSRAAQRGEHCAPLMTQPRSPCQQEKRGREEKSSEDPKRRKKPRRPPWGTVCLTATPPRRDVPLRYHVPTAIAPALRKRRAAEAWAVV